MKKKILFITGTRADFGKIQSVIKILSKRFNVQVIITGMHILKKYGSTYKHVIKNKTERLSHIIFFKNILYTRIKKCIDFLRLYNINTNQLVYRL